MSSRYLQLLGLLSLAQGHIASLNSIQSAAEALTGEKEGRTQDVVWSGDAPLASAEFLLEQLGMEKEEF